MKKLLLFIAILVFTTGNSFAQKNTAWIKVASSSIQQSELLRTTSYSDNQQLYKLNLNQFKQSLANAKDKFSGLPGVVVEFPNVNGVLEQFLVWENSNFSPELQSRFPDIRAFIGKSISDKLATINFSFSPNGIQTITFRADNGTEFIEPFTKDNSVYVFFDSKTRTTARLPFSCSTVDRALNQDLLNDSDIANRSNNQSYKTMRLALSCTGEYGVFFGGTVASALAGMNATMTRVNGVFEKDMALHLNLIPNNDLVVYTSGSSDPYSAAAAGSGGAWNAELQTNLTNVIGSTNYDIGHLFGASGGGGNAGCIGCVCIDPVNPGDTEKGSGYTSPSNNIPQGDTFDIDYVVHEMGHQLGANHSFSHQTEGSGVNVEPGSGSTIMGYAGITSYDVQSNSDAYFTYRNILQMQVNLANKTCPVSTTIANTTPVVNAGADFTVPKGTAFVLRGIASDADGDIMTYCWEQNNSAGSTSSGANSVASPTKNTGPNFRSFTPSASPDRYMPAYSSVLAGTLSTMWESINTTARTSKYSFTARDNNITGAQTNTDEITVTTSATIGPFSFGTISGRNVNDIITWAAGDSKTINWNVNGTNTLPGAANVNIKFSIDGGATFPYVLASDTPNDGTETIVVPETPASLNCRLLIEPTQNVFFAVNTPTLFYVGYQVVPTCTTYTYNTPFALNDGSNSFTVKQINVPTSRVISDVNITVNATHPNLQNLIIAAIRPGGSISNIYSQQCTGSADMNITFDAQGSTLTCASPTTGTFIPPTGFNLDTFNGFNQLGNWQFGFKDIVAGNAGTINSITLQICYNDLVPLATKSYEFENFALYPNPNSGNFTVQFDSKSNNKINIKVHDISGRLIFDKQFPNSGIFNQNLQLDNPKSGIYLVSISDGEKNIVKRIVIQ